MKTLAQIRAMNALACYGQEFGGQQGGEVIKKLPALIQNDGLLAALAFCLEKGGGYLEAANLIAVHLAYRSEQGSIGITSQTEIPCLIQELAEADASLLRRATVEALALLNYMKRFAG